MEKKDSILFFFMDLQEETSRNSKKIGYFKAGILGDYYFMLGCACQGRIDDYRGLYEDLMDEEIDKFSVHLRQIKPYLETISEISKNLDNSKTAIQEAKDGETSGECLNRLLKKDAVFMKNYNALMKEFLKWETKVII